jgi:hypothetical protein
MKHLMDFLVNGAIMFIKLTQKDSTLFSQIILTDSSDNVFANSIVDKNGSFIISGKYHISAVVNGNVICQKKINYYADYPVLDSKGNIWLANPCR